MLNKQDIAFPFIEKIGRNSFFLFLFLFQILFAFQGLDFSDEGFHTTFYQQIYNDPESVQYNFMFWFSGIIGGAWVRLFPEYGLLGLRIGGIIINMITILIVYRFLKAYIVENCLRIGILLLVLLNAAMVKDINYNNISGLFFVLAAFFLFQGICRNNLYRFFIAGSFISLATFTRLTNIGGLSLGLLIIYSGFFVFQKTLVLQLKQVFFFLSGFIVASVGILAAMKFIGHYDVFIGCLKMLGQTAKSKENTHGVSNLIMILFRDYFNAVFKHAVIIAIIVFLGASVLNFFKENKKISRIIYFFFIITFITSLSAFIVSAGTFNVWIFLLMLFTGISVISTACIILKKGSGNLKLISLAGIIVAISSVAGSDYGISASGSTALWISLPIAVESFLGTSLLISGSIVNSQTNPFVFRFSITEHQVKCILQWGVYACILALLIHCTFFTYNDNSDRTQMTSTVNNSFLKGTFTTKKRAVAVTELLEESAKYLKKDDYVIAYEDIPMFYTLTQTKPFIKNSWPRLYDRSILTAELDKALQEKHVLPVVIYQKVTTLPSRYWPDLTQDNSGFNIDSLKNAPIKNFLEKNNYKMVWENIAFRMYIP